MSTLRIGRRNYLRVVGGSIVTAGVAGNTASASTTDYVTISGKLVSHDGDPIAGRKVYVTATGYNETDNSGFFEEEVESGEHVSLGLYKSQGRQLLAPTKNQVPHIDEFASLGYVSSDEELGTFEMPKAYLVNLRALDSDGNPVTNAEFHCRADGFGSGNNLSANNNGYCVIDGANFTGVELVESAEVTIKIPSSGDAVTEYKESINIDGPMTVIAQEGEGLTIKEHTPGETTEATTTTQTPTETTTTATTRTPTPTATSTTTETTPTTTKTTVSTPSQTTTRSTEMAISANGTESKSKRGFFSNGESAGDYDFLTNPFFLTVGGFVLSVAGIAQNLIRGR